MISEKIIKPLDELIGYLSKIPITIEPLPKIPVKIILEEIARIGGKVNRVFYRNNIDIETEIEHIISLSKNRYIRKIKFNGNFSLLKRIEQEESNIYDKYIEEIICLLEATPIIIHTIDGLTEEYKSIISNLCNNLQAYQSVVKSYSAIIPLRKIEELVRIPQVSGIRYNRFLPGRSTTKTFVPSPFW